jgi:hypothetical protein
MHTSFNPCHEHVLQRWIIYRTIIIASGPVDHSIIRFTPSGAARLGVRRLLLGFYVSEIVLRQASASLKINRSNTTSSSVALPNSMCPRDLGAVHQRDLVIGKLWRTSRLRRWRQGSAHRRAL